MRQFVTLVIAVALSACSGPSNPSSLGTTTPTVRTVIISGNNRLTSSGQTTQLSAIATMSNGSTKDVTSTVTWRTDNSNVVTVSQTGLVTAVNFGQADISGNGDLFPIFVLTEGTYILRGQCVQDLSRPPDATSDCLADSRIEIIGGPTSGRTTMTDQGGNWEFIGVSGVLQVRVSKQGYTTTVQDVPQNAGPLPIIAVCGPGLLPVAGGSTRAPGCI
jgi:hypothetical protein